MDVLSGLIHRWRWSGEPYIPNCLSVGRNLGESSAGDLPQAGFGPASTGVRPARTFKVASDAGMMLWSAQRSAFSPAHHAPPHSESREVSWRSGPLNELQDIFHVRIDVLPELLQAAAQVVQPRLAIAGTNKPVLGTLPVTGKPVLALAALLRQSIALGEAEFLLLLGENHPR